MLALLLIQLELKMQLHQENKMGFPLLSKLDF